MSSRSLTLEHLLYSLALGIALGLRFLHLGRLPLSDYEATWALQALAIVRGEHPAVGPNPAYVHLTALLFALLGTSNFLARFWPALAGTLVVLAPWFVRSRLGRVPALVLAFGLALDPALNALARQAGGPMLAVASLVFGLVFCLEGRRHLAGAALGLALLSGPAAWFGLAVAGLTWALWRLLARRKPASLAGPDAAEGAETLPDTQSASQQPAADSLADSAPPSEWRRPLLWGALVFLSVGTLFLFSPSGLAGFAESLLLFGRGLWTSADVPLGRTLLALPAYAFLPILLAGVALVRAWVEQDDLSFRLGVWALAGLLAVLVYTGRQPADLIWMILPLWALTALEVGRHFDFSGRNPWLVAAAWTLVFVLGMIFWMALARLTTVDFANPVFRWQWVILILLPLIALTSVVLLGYGWAMDEARLGGMWGLLTVLVLYTLGVATGAAQVREPRTYELWYPEPRPGRLEVLAKVMDEISLMNTGARASLPVTMVGLDAPSLVWLLREWPLRQAAIFDPNVVPEMLITSAGSEPTLAADYRGAPFVWREMADWPQATPQLWFKWFVYRQIPVQQQDVVLWVRRDLMLDSPLP